MLSSYRTVLGTTTVTYGVHNAFTGAEVVAATAATAGTTTSTLRHFTSGDVTGPAIVRWYESGEQVADEFVAYTLYATAASLASARTAITGTLTTVRSELATKATAASLASARTAITGTLTTMRSEYATAASLRATNAAVTVISERTADILIDTGSTLDTKINTLQTRLSAARAGYLDNLSAGAVSTSASLASARTAITGTLTTMRGEYALAASVATAASLASARTAITGTLTTIRSEYATAASLASARTAITGSITTMRGEYATAASLAPVAASLSTLDAVADNILRTYTNKRTVTETAQVLYADDDSTPLYTQVLSDDKTTSQRDKAT